jgi:hypothetical protein
MRSLSPAARRSDRGRLDSFQAEERREQEETLAFHRAQTYRLLDDRDPASEQLAVRHEVLRGELGRDRALLLEEVHDGGLRPVLGDPASAVLGQVRGADVVVGERTPRAVGPVGPDRDDVAGVDLGPCALESVRVDRLPLADVVDVHDHGLADHPIQLHAADRRAVGHHMQG